jgi:hypothetical protein
MSDHLTVILHDRSICVDRRYALMIREAQARRVSFLPIEVFCSLHPDAPAEPMTLDVRNVVDIVEHDAEPPGSAIAGPERKIVAFRPRRAEA